MKLSIITINLNNRDGLKKTIDSVVSQTFTDFEWIVIDGGSTDGSRELIEEYSSHFAYWVSEPDKGIYNAMNKGIGHAKGEYCQFLNSGDWLVSSTILKTVFSRNFSEDIVYGNIDFYDQSTFREHIVYPSPLSFNTFYEGSIGHNSSFIKTSLLQEVLYDESLRIVSDWKFFFQMFLESKTFYHIEHCIGCFDINGISERMVNLREQEREQTIIELYEKIARWSISLNHKAESFLANTPLNYYVELCESNRLLAKCITFLVLTMKKKANKLF